MQVIPIRAKFLPGNVVATPAFKEKAKGADRYMLECLIKHLAGEWGMVSAGDRAANDAALRDGSRILSAYPLPNDPAMFWILTEADRSYTTFLLPSEY